MKNYYKIPNLNSDIYIKTDSINFEVIQIIDDVDIKSISKSLSETKYNTISNNQSSFQSITEVEFENAKTSVLGFLG